MVTSLDQRVTQMSQGEDARLRMLHDSKQRLIEGLQAIAVAREIQDERRSKEIKVLESNVMLEAANASQMRAEIHSRLEELTAQRFGEHQVDLARHREQRSAAHEETSRVLGEEVRRIASILEEQRAARIESGDRIAASLDAEFQKIHEAIVAEEKLRFDAEGTMLSMVEDVRSKMIGEIQQERHEREAVQSKLLGLLEDTCNRIESGFCPSAAPSAYGTATPMSIATGAITR